MRYFVLHDNPADGMVEKEFDNEKDAQDCAGSIGLVVVPLYEVKLLAPVPSVIGERVMNTIEFLLSLANRLDRWADETRYYGWNTHQVEANRGAANECRRQAANLIQDLAAKSQ